MTMTNDCTMPYLAVVLPQFQIIPFLSLQHISRAYIEEAVRTLSSIRDR